MSYRDARPRPAGPALLALAASAALFVLLGFGLGTGDRTGAARVVAIAAFDIARPPAPEPDPAPTPETAAPRSTSPATTQTARALPAATPILPQTVLTQALAPALPAVIRVPATVASPAPVAPASPLPAPPAVDGEADALAAYTAQLRRRILARRPARTGGGGETVITFRLDRRGALMESTIATSGGSVRLDRLALRMVRQAAPFPAPDPAIADDRLLFTLPIRFH